MTEHIDADDLTDDAKVELRDAGRHERRRAYEMKVAGYSILHRAKAEGLLDEDDVSDLHEFLLDLDVVPAHEAGDWLARARRVVRVAQGNSASRLGEVRSHAGQRPRYYVFISAIPAFLSSMHCHNAVCVVHDQDLALRVAEHLKAESAGFSRECWPFVFDVDRLGPALMYQSDKAIAAVFARSATPPRPAE